MTIHIVPIDIVAMREACASLDAAEVFMSVDDLLSWGLEFLLSGTAATNNSYEKNYELARGSLYGFVMECIYSAEEPDDGVELALSTINTLAEACADIYEQLKPRIQSLTAQGVECGDEFIYTDYNTLRGCIYVSEGGDDGSGRRY